MKEIRGMKRGVKLEPKLNKTEQIASMDKELKNVQMSVRVSQMMLQQLLQSMQTMQKDLGKAFGTINELQYKMLAFQSVANVDLVAMEAKANEFRLKDFNEASDAEDVASNFTVGDVVQEDSTVILTSTAADGTGLFRSRIKLAESGVPALVEGLTGKTVGTKVKCVLNGVEHEVELLGVRNPPPAAPVEQAEVVPPAGDVVQVGETVTDFDGSQTSEFVRVPRGEQVH